MFCTLCYVLLSCQPHLIAFGIYSFFDLTAFITQHSGLWNVNPGIAVHMENGETIAQWRKLYFQKFGV